MFLRNNCLYLHKPIRLHKVKWITLALCFPPKNVPIRAQTTVQLCFRPGDRTDKRLTLRVTRVTFCLVIPTYLVFPELFGVLIHPALEV